MQAVHAKSSHYFPKTAQARYSSESVKIAKLVHHLPVGHGAVAVFPGAVDFTPPEAVTALRSIEFPIQKLSEQISFRHLRAPPVSL